MLLFQVSLVYRNLRREAEEGAGSPCVGSRKMVSELVPFPFT